HDSQVVFSLMIHSTSLTSLDRDSLEKHVLLDEIKTAVWDCSRNKASGPDGLSASILFNGIPTFEFSIKRDLQQGDSLSHFLFILAMEGLHGAMSNLVNSGLIRGIKLGYFDTTLSYLCYAGDVVIPFEWNYALEVFSSSNAYWVKVIKALHGQEGGLDHQGCNFNNSWSRIVKADIGIQNIAYLRELLLEISLDLNSQDDICILSMVNDGVFSNLLNIISLNVIQLKRSGRMFSSTACSKASGGTPVAGLKTSIMPDGRVWVTCTCPDPSYPD
nr:reverse transcriptase domain, reverse transcriptase zinc-binding domain protein [Tanacetum cinerariifolium]